MEMADRSGAGGNLAAPIHWLVPHSQEVLSLPEQIASKLGDRIVSGEIEPGARIIEQAVASEFGVSRGPIREAFRILERERLVDNHPRRGISVAVLTPADLNEVFEIVQALTSVVGKRLAQQRSSEAVHILDQGIEQAEPSVADANAASIFAAAGYRMGIALARLGNNRRLVTILSTLSLESFRYRRIAYQAESHRRAVVARWKKLRTAIKKGDGDAAVEAWSQISAANREMLTSALSHPLNGE